VLTYNVLTLLLHFMRRGRFAETQDWPRFFRFFGHEPTAVVEQRQGEPVN